MKNRRSIMNYYLMLLPSIAFLLVFSVLPMVGLVIAFQKFTPGKGLFGSPWVGFDNILYMFQIPDSLQVLTNTVIIAMLKIIVGLIVPIIFALILNETVNRAFKRTIQTIVYLPHFLSWVILSGIIMDLLSNKGFVNTLLGFFSVEPIMFLSSNAWFRPIIIITDIWKEFGFGTIIYLAALTGINPVLYEAAEIDGASRFKKLLHITMPGITPTIILLTTLSLGNVLNAGFDQLFNLYNPLVYSTADIIDTYVYRVGLVQMQYGLATSVGFLKSLVSMLLILLSYKLAARFANYRIF